MQPNVNPNDPDVIALSKAIIQHESGGDFNAVGDAGTSHGAAQWQPATWKAQAQDILGDPNAKMTPENQKAVIAGSIAKDKASGLNPAQIAAKWNSGQPDNWENKIGTTTINGQQIKYNVPQYVKSVTDLYQQYKGQGGAPDQPQGAGALPGYPAPPVAQPYAPPTPVAPGASQNGGIMSDLQNDISGTSTKSAGGQALDAAKGIGNFLFPIVGDVYHDFKGDSQKTFLQQAGDTALSALPFIPGLGELGEGARGVEAGAEGINAVAKSGLLGKLAGSTVAKGAGVGYGAGVASSLSQGDSIGQSLTPNVNNISGAVLGGAAPAVLKGASGIVKGIAGINPQIETELTSLGSKGDPNDVKLYDDYINATKQHATNVRARAPLSIAADNLDQAAKKITQITDKAGADVGAAKDAAGHLPLQSTPAIAQDFAKMAGDKFGLDITTGQDGAIKVSMLPDSMRQVSPADMTRIRNVAEQLNELGGANVKQASQIINNLNDLVDHSKDDMYGHTNDPLEGILKKTAGNINDAIRGTSEEVAAANDRFHGLKNLQDEISGMAGKNLQKGELLMRRVFSGDKSGDVNDLFGKIKNETGVDLVKHAVLAKHAIESYGSKADKTLLEQIIEGGSKGGGLLGGVLNAAKGAARATFANPRSIGRDLVKGKSNGLLSNGITKGAIEASRAAKPISRLLTPIQ